MRLAVILTLWLLMAAPAFCQEANEPRAIPAPESLVTSDAISLAVVEARTEDKGFQALLQAAWEAFGGVSGDGANPFLKYVLRAIQIQRGSNALASGGGALAPPIRQYLRGRQYLWGRQHLWGRQCTGGCLFRHRPVAPACRHGGHKLAPGVGSCVASLQ